jgi:hypothetical protein
MASDPDKIKFHYIKGNFFRVVHVDGVFGGLSPTGEISASLFSQRPPIPQLTVQALKSKNELGEEIVAERVSKDGLVREMEVSLVLSPQVAEALAKWLMERVEQHKKLTAGEEPKGTHVTTKHN